MSFGYSLDSILPSLTALGVLGYWIVGLAAGLESWFLTGFAVPGSLIVDAAGMLAQRGVLDFWDLFWFVAAGSTLGAQAGYWTGRLARARLTGRLAVQSWPAYARAEALFTRRGGPALVIGRFLGPVSGLVPLVAALTGMDARRFLLWSALASLPYALAHLALGYFLGDILMHLSPALTRAALILGAALVATVVVVWLMWRLVRFLPRSLMLARTILSALAARPEAQRLARRYPRIAAFLGHRLDQDRFSGLPLTALTTIFLYILVVFLDGVFEFLRSDPILQVDLRLAQLIHAFWTPGLIRLAAHVTALGDWRVVGTLMVAALVWLVLRGRKDLAAGLVLSVVGNLVSVNLLKGVFDRPRPELAYFAETSNSFPSGHAAVSVAFWGMLAFAAWRVGRVGPLLAAILAGLSALMIGGSRLYLIEHYLTDVLNGWLLGGLWLVAGMTLAGWWHARHPGTRPQLRRRTRAMAGLAALLCIFAAGWTTARYDKALAVPPVAAGPLRLASAEALFSVAGRPAVSESLLGNPLEPINVLILARDRQTLIRAMVHAGWTQAQTPSPLALVRALWALITNVPDPLAPVTPYFWDGAPNLLAFERPADVGGPRERHHVRFWQTRAILPDGRLLFVGAASFDDGLDPTLLHHIAPDIDAERAQLAADLTAAGAAQALGMVMVAGPRQGTSVAGDPWFTDGQAVLLGLD